MKKALTITTVILSTIALAACGNSSSKKGSSKSTSTVSKPVAQKYYFKDGTLKIHDLKIHITKAQIIPVGQKGNEYGDKDVIAFWYDTTNFTDKEIDPTTAWMTTMKAYQDTSSSQVHEMKVGSLPDDQFLDTQTETIKKGKTASNAVSYELTDDTTPVKLKGVQGVDDKVLGTQTYDIKNLK